VSQMAHDDGFSADLPVARSTHKLNPLRTVLVSTSRLADATTTNRQPGLNAFSGIQGDLCPGCAARLNHPSGMMGGRTLVLDAIRPLQPATLIYDHTLLLRATSQEQRRLWLWYLWPSLSEK
jgi:hypothetical protein